MAGLLGHTRRIAVPNAHHRVTEAVWTEAALTNLRAIRVYIEQFNPSAAGRVAAELIAAANSLAASPIAAGLFQRPRCGNW